MFTSRASKMTLPSVRSTCLSFSEIIAPSRPGQQSKSHHGAIPPLDLAGHRHPVERMAHLIERRCSRFSPRLGNAGILLAGIEVFGIRVGQTRTIARLSGQPEKEISQEGKRRIEGSLAKSVAAAPAHLLRKMPLEGHRLLTMERLKLTVACIGLKSVQSRGNTIYRCLTKAFCLAEVGEIPMLNPLIFGVVSA